MNKVYDQRVRKTQVFLSEKKRLTKMNLYLRNVINACVSRTSFVRRTKGIWQRRGERTHHALYKDQKLPTNKLVTVTKDSALMPEIIIVQIDNYLSALVPIIAHY